MVHSARIRIAGRRRGPRTGGKEFTAEEILKIKRFMVGPNGYGDIARFARSLPRHSVVAVMSKMRHIRASIPKGCAAMIVDTPFTHAECMRMILGVP